MWYVLAVAALVGIILGQIPNKKERARRRAVKEARDNFYLREEAKFRTANNQVAGPE